jgi:sigma-B regulation protein RsbU (phosphoserine phosphatase)
VHALVRAEKVVANFDRGLTAPLRADAINLGQLISHRASVQAGESVDAVYRKFQNELFNFIAVLEGERLAGMCSRQETAALLGGRYGFSLWATKPIRDHLAKVETRIAADTPIAEVLHVVFARPDENFYDNVLLVDGKGGFLGFITTETLFKVQNALLLTNIRDLEEKDREIEAKNRQMEADLRMAMELQQALMPLAYPFFPSDANEATTTLHFYHRYMPASIVGGDFFHIFRLTDSAAGILICDVMGHGVRAALVTAMLRALIEALGPQASDPGALLTHVNGQFTGIVKQTGTLVFATALYCVIHAERRELCHARAGHPAPLWARRSAGRVETLTSDVGSAGPALGLLTNARFGTTRTQLDAGDFLLLFTDGIIEVESQNGAEFGLDGLRAGVYSGLQESTRAVVDAVIEKVCSFSGSPVFNDDVCLVAAELGHKIDGANPSV